MKAGLTTSVIGHLLLLAWGLFQLPGAKPFEVEQVDALPIDLVSISELNQIAEGSKTAPLSDTASQAKVETPAPRPESPRPGNAPNEQETPVTEKATETAAAPEASAPPPTPPPPPPKAEKPPEPKPPEPKAPEPPPEPEPAPEPPAPEKPVDAPKPTADVGELKAEPEKPVEAAKPAPAPAVKPTARPKPPKPVEVASAEDAPDAPAPEKKAPKKPQAEKQTDKPEKKSEKDFNVNDMSALLNKIDPSGGGAKASPEEASLGSNKAKGPVANMTQNELSALRARLEQCWSPPIGADGIETMSVPVRIELNPDGSLAADPIAKQIPPGPMGQILAEAALRAIRRCAPYGDVLPPEKFDAWQVVNINFSPGEMF